MTPDVNVLLAAARVDHIHHAVAFAWLNRACESMRRGARLALPGAVVSGYLRLATHPRIFETPTPLPLAIGFIDDLAQAGATMLSGAEWPQFRQACLDRQATGARVSDAWLAACVLQHNERFATFDRDFERLLPAENLELLAP